MGSQGQGHGHCEKQPSEGSNEDAHMGSQGQGHGHCEKWPSKCGNKDAHAEWPSEGGNEGAHVCSQGHPELELGLEDEQEEGADGMVIAMAQAGC